MRPKIMLRSALALIALAFALEAGAATPSPTTQRYEVTASVAVRTKLNLRAGPGTNYRILAKLLPGTRLVSVVRTRRTEKRPEFAQRFRWYRVRLLPVRAKPIEGWVYGAYLAIGGRHPVKRATDRAPLEKLAQKGAALLAMPDKSRLAWLVARSKALAKAAYERAKQLAAAGVKHLVAAVAGTKPKTTPKTKPKTKPKTTPKKATPQKTPPKAAPAAQLGATLDLAKRLPGFAYFNQGDPRWGKKRIATSATRTISQIGCALTSAAMAIQFFGKKLTPAELNDTLVKRKGFIGVLLNFGAAAALAGRKIVDSLDASLGWEGNHERALRLAREHFAKERSPLIGQVDYVSDTDNRGDHFVLISGLDAAGDPIIYDPGARANQGKPLAQVETHKGYLLLRVLRLAAK